jgi:hypothetical protein
MSEEGAGGEVTAEYDDAEAPEGPEDSDGVSKPTTAGGTRRKVSNEW